MMFCEVACFLQACDLFQWLFYGAEDAATRGACLILPVHEQTFVQSFAMFWIVYNCTVSHFKAYPFL